MIAFGIAAKSNGVGLWFESIVLTKNPGFLPGFSIEQVIINELTH